MLDDIWTIEQVADDTDEDVYAQNWVTVLPRVGIVVNTKKISNNDCSIGVGSAEIQRG